VESNKQRVPGQVIQPPSCTKGGFFGIGVKALQGFRWIIPFLDFYGPASGFVKAESLGVIAGRVGPFYGFGFHGLREVFDYANKEGNDWNEPSSQTGGLKEPERAP
jgi:hypothetical protein